MTVRPTIRREIIVDADPSTAFEVFTVRMGEWWPVADFAPTAPDHRSGSGSGSGSRSRSRSGSGSGSGSGTA